MRIILVIFALWILVVEPTFRAFEEAERQSAQQEPLGGEKYQEVDQPIPPGYVVAPQWMNEHFRVVLAVPLSEGFNSVSPRHRPAPAVFAGPVRDELCLPYPPSALPLRL